MIHKLRHEHQLDKGTTCYNYQFADSFMLSLRSPGFSKTSIARLTAETFFMTLLQLQIAIQLIIPNNWVTDISNI